MRGGHRQRDRTGSAASARRPCSLGIVLIALLPFASCGDTGHDATGPAAEDQVDQSVERFVDQALPEGAGGTLVAARNGEIAHCAGFGMADRDAQVAAGCDTVYDIQSMTKQFTAAAVLKLEMMGRLRVSDPISKHLGPVPADKREITLHQLLTHTAGLVDVLGGDYEPLTREEMVAGALASKLRSPPGAEYRYSNLGYSLLAAIIERASGKGYEEFLAEQLFTPAGMTQTGYVLPEWRPDHVAVSYDARGEPRGRPFDHPWAADGPYWNLRGNGGLLSTARDIFRWHLALEGDEILDRRATRRLFMPHVVAREGRDSHYGYGWILQRTDDHGRVAWHDGGNAWPFGVFTRFLEEGVMVFWVTSGYRDKREGWNLASLDPRLTRGIADRLREGG